MPIQQIQKTTLFVLFVAALGLIVWMISPFLLSLFWAGVLASLFYPIYKRVYNKTKRKNFSSLLTITIVLLLVILPLVAVSGSVIKESISLYSVLNNPDTILEIKTTANQVSNFPFMCNFFQNIEIENEIKNISTTFVSGAFSGLKSWTQNLALMVINLFIMLYAMFYFLRDGEAFSQYVLKALPLKEGVGKSFANKFILTSRATLKGTILLGFIQGILGGITIFVVGIPSVFLLTLVMIILSIIPAVGPMLVLIPITIYLLIWGNAWQVVVLVIGMFIVGLSDNFLRPELVGRDLNMHPLVVFLSTIGGLSLFGLSGVVIGPIAAALLISILDIYSELKTK